MIGKEDLIIFICAISIIILMALSPFFEVMSQRRTCMNQANAMGFGYEYKWYVIGENVCTYIMPDGKRIISTKYRALED